MNELPQILANGRVALTPAVADDLVAVLGGGAAVVPKVLPITVDPQHGDNWCWAAIGVAIAHYHDGVSQDQCVLATKVTNLPSNNPSGAHVECCPAKTNESTCDKERSFSEALTVNGNFAGFFSVQTPPKWNDLKALIRDQELPIPAIVAFSNSGFHLVLISGYSDNFPKQLFVQDPANGNGWFEFSRFLSKYGGDGSWERGYLTQSSA